MALPIWLLGAGRCIRPFQISGQNEDLRNLSLGDKETIETFELPREEPGQDYVGELTQTIDKGGNVLHEIVA